MRIQVVSSFRTARLLAVAAVVAAAGGMALVWWQSGVWASDAFTDVADDNVHHDSSRAIAEAGVTLGCGEGRYCPADAVRRDQMASFMDRLGALSGQAPVVNAATAEQADDSAALGGIGAQELLDRIQALEERQGDGDLAESVEVLKTQLADATGRIDALEGDLATAAGRIDTLEAANAELAGRIDEVEALLAGVARSTVEGRDTLQFSGMNVQVVNGTGGTEGVPNGLGNVIIGYNAERPDSLGGTDPATDRAGSHYLITGDRHHWTAYGGLLAGIGNTASGDAASVTGGEGNTASGEWASVTGGSGNTASGFLASVTGGGGNTASGFLASVTGGEGNTASGFLASVTGGGGNIASGDAASVSGGRDNIAEGDWASAAGGVGNTASGSWASVLGGQLNLASGSRAAVAGGRTNTAAANWSSILGGGGRALTDSPANECNSQAGSQVFADTCPF